MSSVTLLHVGAPVRGRYKGNAMTSTARHMVRPYAGGIKADADWLEVRLTVRPYAGGIKGVKTQPKLVHPYAGGIKARRSAIKEKNTKDFSAIADIIGGAHSAARRERSVKNE